MTKVIIVSPEEYFDFFKSTFPDWDIQHPVLTIDQMWLELGNGDLDINSQIVVLNDNDYSDQNENLEVAIRDISAEALVLVIAEENFREGIAQKLQRMQERDYIPVYKFWFVSRTDPIEDINRAITEYTEYVPIREQQKATLAAQSQNQTVIEDTEYPTSISNNETHSEETKTSPSSNNAYAGDGYQGPPRKGMIIASTSSKGGSGKSTVALCTASMLYHASRLASEAGQSDRPLDVVVVDMDVRDGQIGFFLSQSAPTILNIFTSQDFSRTNIRQNLVYDERLGIHALLAPKRARTADYVTPELYWDIINKLRTMFDIVILDTSVNYLDPLISEVVLPLADAVLFVTNMSRGSVFGMTRWITEVTLSKEEGGSAGISKDKIGIVVNQSMGNVGFDQKNLELAASEVPLLVSIPMDSAAVLTATNNNHLDAIVLRHPTISPAYYDLIGKILQGSRPTIQPDTTAQPGQQSAAVAKSNHKGPILPSKKKKKIWGK